MFSEFVDLKHKDYPGQNLKLASIWLRDHCRCKECYNHSTKQRLLDLTKLPENLKVKSFSEKPNGYIFVQCKSKHIC